MSRKIFITIGVIFNLTQLLFPFWAWATELTFVKDGPVFGGWDFLGYYMILLVYLLIIGVFYSFRDVVPPSWWIFSPKKRIVHGELGELWAEIATDNGNNKVMRIYKQFWLYSKIITEVEYTDDKYSLISLTKHKLDYIVRERETEKEKKKSENPAFDEWDGYLDKQSERDDKLNKIGI